MAKQTVQLFVIDSSNNWIELDTIETEIIRFTKQSSILEEPEVIPSNYTKNFRLPHTTINGNFFKAAFNVNSADFNPLVKVPSYINVDGSLFTTGDIRLNGVIRNDKLKKIEYDVIFIGEIGSFGSTISSKLMTDLDLSDTTHQLSYNNILSSWTNGLFNGTIVYPLVEWGYEYDTSGGSSVPIQNTVSRFISGSKGFTKPAHPLSIGQFKPMVKVKYLFDKILSEAGFEYSSNFFNTDIIDKLYHISTGPETSSALSPTGLVAKYNCKLSSDTSAVWTVPFPPIPPFVTWTAVGGLDKYAITVGTQSAIYTVPTSATSIISNLYNAVQTSYSLIPFKTISQVVLNTLPFWRTYVKIPFTGVFGVEVSDLVFRCFNAAGISTWSGPSSQESQDIVVTLWKNGVQIDSVTGKFAPKQTSKDYTVYFGPLANSPSYVFTGVACNIADEIDVRLNVSAFQFGWYAVTNGSNQTMNVSVFNINGYTTNMISYFPTDYKQIDFIRSLSDKFKLVWEPDPQNPKKFLIEPWTDWIKSGSRRDWSNKLDENININVVPLFQSQPKLRNWKDRPETDINNYNFQQEFKKGFGELNLDSGIEVISGEKTIETKIAPIQLSPIGNSDTFLIPHLAKDTGTQVVPIEVVPRFCFYNGYIDNPWDPIAADYFKWYLYNDTASVYYEHYKYPLISNYYGSIPFDNNSLDISWKNVNQYWELLTATLSNVYGDGVTDQTAFTKYWGEWYDMTYNTYQTQGITYSGQYVKILEAQFALDTNDIRELRFNDRIWVKDAWYFPIEIKDYILNEKQNVMVKLLQVGNVNIQEGAYIKFDVCYGSTECEACCCANTMEVWSLSGGLQNQGVFIDSNGNYQINDGWYRVAGLSGTQSFQYTNGVSSALGYTCSSCSCAPILYPIGVCIDNFVNNVCCCLSPSYTVYANDINLDTSTQIWDDIGGTIPLSPFTWIKEPGGAYAVQVGADGHTVVQFNNCSGIIC